MKKATTILWLRQDLRLSDHPALAYALAQGHVVPVYIDDPADPWPVRGAAQKFLKTSLGELAVGFADLGARLIQTKGDPLKVLKALIKETDASCVVWSRLYEPYARERDAHIEKQLVSSGIEVKSFNASLLFEPWTIQTKSGGPFKIFTPFAKACLASPPPEAPIISRKNKVSASMKRLHHFIDEILVSYKQDRDRPDRDGTSRLSAYLHFGQIGPRQVWHAVQHAMAERPELASGGETFLRQLLWREFSYHLLFHFPLMPEKPLQAAYAKMPWRKDEGALKAWREGRTGYPIVDAGMRQLVQTGWMHNRVRMIVASFLVKDLLLPWQVGEAWFWEKLNDADLANNAASWQWVAGCGTDAAPYFRVFNPVLQGQKFDPEGAYIREYVPELKGLKGQAIHAPWLLDEAALRLSGLRLGRDYPLPIIDHKAARERALLALKKVKKS